MRNSFGREILIFLGGQACFATVKSQRTYRCLTWISANDRTFHCFLLCLYHYQMSIIGKFFCLFSSIKWKDLKRKKKFKERVKLSMYQQTKVQQSLSLVSVTFFTTLYCCPVFCLCFKVCLLRGENVYMVCKGIIWLHFLYWYFAFYMSLGYFQLFAKQI